MAQQVGDLLDGALLSDQLGCQTVTQEVGTGSWKLQVASLQPATDEGGQRGTAAERTRGWPVAKEDLRSLGLWPGVKHVFRKRVAHLLQ
jgi:hypothetical protein